MPVLTTPSELNEFKEPEDLRAKSLAANEELLKINHEIRQLENALKIAQRRRLLATWSFVLGPIFALVLYVLAWLPWFSWHSLGWIYVISAPVVVVFFVLALKLTKDPGGPRVKFTNGTTRRYSESDLELSLARTQDLRKLKLAYGVYDATTRRLVYKEEAYGTIENLRTESRKYRSINNLMQAVLIIGALGATGSSAIAAELTTLRWVTFGISISVGIASGFMGYYKYKERSFYLQQTADAIEHEWEAFEVGVGRYKRADNEDQALEDFVEEVHRLKSEQRKRQQNLEQPPEVRGATES